uniref:Reductase n=1 Tax=Anisakis simplex TaxID=6269 RepID=A0A0M3JM82_ANISI
LDDYNQGLLADARVCGVWAELVVRPQSVVGDGDGIVTMRHWTQALAQATPTRRVRCTRARRQPVVERIQ